MWRCSRFMNTAATWPRSLARPVSFSTIEARITICSGEVIGSAGLWPAQTAATAFCCASTMRSSTVWRATPGS